MQHNKWAAHAAVLILLGTAAAFGAGQVSVMDPITKLPKYIKGGEGISINGASGTITATGTAVIAGNIPFDNISTGLRSKYLPINSAAANANAYKGNSAPSATEFSYLDGVTAPIQGQISSVRVTAEGKPSLSNVVPTMNGIAAAGTGPTASRVDHVHASDTSREPANANIQAHISSTSNPHSVTKTQVGLGNADNTSDANKPISTATQTALNLKANTSSLATVATTGSYTDLSNKPAVYTLPTASTTVKGGVKIDGTSIVVDGNGVISSTVSAGVSTVNGGTGDVTVTPENIGAATLAQFTNYTSIDRPARSEVATAAQGAKADTALQSANYKIKNVLTLGILNNGSDQGTAIQALFDAAVNNDTFYFPKGNYGTSVQLKLPSDKMIRIIGDGPGATTFTALANLRSVFLKEGTRIEGIEFRDFFIEGNVPSKAQIGITLRSGVETKIENVYIARTSEAGLAFGTPIEWDSSKTYHQYQYVTSAGHIFRSLQNSNSNHSPTIGGDTWWTDLETYDVSSNGLIYDTRMKSVTLRSANSPSQGLFGIHQYASANDNWIGNCIIANYAVANIFDEAGYTFYHKVYMNGSPLSSSAPYGIWSVTQFTSADADAGITVNESYFDGMGPTGGAGAAIRLDKGGNLITNSTFYRGNSATTNAGIEMKNGITRTSIVNNRFDNVVPTVFQSSGTYGAEYYFLGNVGGLSPGSTINIINSVATTTPAAAGLGNVTNDAQLKASQLVTSVGSPGLDANVPSEKAVRSAIAASSGGLSDPGSNGVVTRTSLNATSVAAYGDIVGLFGSGTCSGYLKSDGSCGTTAGMVYPAAGVPSSNGSAWGSSYTVGTGANNLVQLDSSSRLPTVNGSLLTSLPSQLTTTSVTINPSSTSNTAGLSVTRAVPDFAAASAYSLIDVSLTANTSSPNAGSSLRALNLAPFYSGSGTLPTMYGVFASPRNTGTGTVGSLIGFNVWPRNTSSGTVTGITGVYLQSPSNSGTIGANGVTGLRVENHGLSGVNTTYGIKLDDQSGSTNPYSIYTGTGPVRFGDSVSITGNLTVSGTINNPASATTTSTTVDTLATPVALISSASTTSLTLNNVVAGRCFSIIMRSTSGGAISTSGATLEHMDGSPASITAGSCTDLVCMGVASGKAHCVKKENYTCTAF